MLPVDNIGSIAKVRGKRKYLLEEERVFSESLLWQLQRDFFDEKGAAAWQSGQVPHYVTSSPTLANSYAEIVFAFWRDRKRMTSSVESLEPSRDEPLYICELGAGSGRFAFHFITRFVKLCEQFQQETIPICYVMTDFTCSNLAFWKRHPQFAPFFQRGLLDMALFDINKSNRLQLQISNREIAASELANPLVVIANYVFDSIPQDLYYLEQRNWFQCLVTLSHDQDPGTLSPEEVLSNVHVKYTHRSIPAPTFPEHDWNQLILEYGNTLNSTHLLVPTVGLRCLQNMKSLSRKGLMLLTADKGNHDPTLLPYKPASGLVRHGSFSLPVNFHAFRWLCERNGGRALFPEHPHHHIDVGCLLMLDNPEQYMDTCAAYERYVNEFGPDDFYNIAKHARNQYSDMGLKEMMAYIRLSRYDSHHFSHYLPRLFELAPTFSERERALMIDTVHKVWATYFSLGEDMDLAYHIAAMFYEMGCYSQANDYFQRSVHIYGEHTGTLYNMALCYFLLEEFEQAELLLKKVLIYDPVNEEATLLLTQIHSRNISES